MGTVTKVVIDTNVFISAFGWDGKPEALLRLMEQQRIVNCGKVRQAHSQHGCFHHH